MSTIRELFKLNEYIQLGVCPMKEIQHDVNRNLAALSPEDQRRTKRRFRKLWRKLAAEKYTTPDRSDEDEEQDQDQDDDEGWSVRDKSAGSLVGVADPLATLKMPLEGWDLERVDQE